MGRAGAVVSLPIDIARALPHGHIVSACVHGDAVRRVGVIKRVVGLDAGRSGIDPSLAPAGREAQQPEPIGLCVVIDGDLGFDSPCLQFEVPIPTESGIPGVVGAGRDIGPGQLTK